MFQFTWRYTKRVTSSLFFSYSSFQWCWQCFNKVRPGSHMWPFEWLPNKMCGFWQNNVLELHLYGYTHGYIHVRKLMSLSIIDRLCQSILQKQNEKKYPTANMWWWLADERCCILRAPVPNLFVSTVSVSVCVCRSQCVSLSASLQFTGQCRCAGGSTNQPSAAGQASAGSNPPLPWKQGSRWPLPLPFHGLWSPQTEAPPTRGGASKHRPPSINAPRPLNLRSLQTTETLWGHAMKATQ